ncbi:MAG: class I SAM-dependent methyltransferase, partial [Actinomycetota bacterium]
MQRYVLDESRALWWPLVRADLSETTAVDLGAGWGAISAGLARTGARVIAVEKIPVRARFLKKRLEQEGLDNAHIVAADFNALPFRPGFAELVVANGVLEWAGTFSEEPSVPAAQLKFLETCRRLIKPDGSIYIGIENRWSPFTLLGMRDHTGLWGTNLLPRRVADAVVRLRGMKFAGGDENVKGAAAGYRTYTYGIRGYRRLISRAGLEPVFFVPIPDYNRPAIVLPLEPHRRRVASHAIDLAPPANMQQAVLLRLARIALALPGFEYLAPCYSIIAGAEGDCGRRAKVGATLTTWVLRDDDREAQRLTVGSSGHFESSSVEAGGKNALWSLYRLIPRRRKIGSVGTAVCSELRSFHDRRPLPDANGASMAAVLRAQPGVEMLWRLAENAFPEPVLNRRVSVHGRCWLGNATGAAGGMRLIGSVEPPSAGTALDDLLCLWLTTAHRLCTRIGPA